MRDERSVCEASELASAKDSEVCFASDTHFRRFDDCREFARSKRAVSSADDSSDFSTAKKSAGVEFTLGTPLFREQFIGLVTWFPKQEKFAARLATSLESEPNQTLEPTAPSGRGSS